jgi:hypothetical protein
MTGLRCILWVAVLAGCAASDAAPGTPPTSPSPSPPAPPATADGHRLTPSPHLDQAVRSQLDAASTQRSYLQVDKPLYQPGETVWFRADLRATKTLLGAPPMGITMQLVAPSGSIVTTKRVLEQGGVARNDFQLAADIAGGEYVLRMMSDTGVVDQRKIIINTYEAPRLMKTVELLRKAYGPGDTVTAAIAVKRQTGEPFASREVTAVVTVDDVEVSRTKLTTDKDGAAVARAQLPAAIQRGDGVLALLVEDGGVTESMQKPIPIVLATLQLAVFPESGHLVAGVASRVYFMAKTPAGKPADIDGTVLDDRGAVIAQLASIHDGMGKFDLQPAAERRYHVAITRPANITTTVDLPAAVAEGCVLRATDQTKPDVVAVLATCKTARHVAIEATLRENRLAGGGFAVAANTPALVELPVPRTQQGVVRVTLFTDADVPLAERLVYHGLGSDPKITVTSDRASYAPRDTVKLHVHASDAHGDPVKASLGLAVVDDTVLSFADDKTARILAHVYLEPELGATAADPIDEPNYYFSDKPEAAAAMDALLGTRGYRQFVWQKVAP